MSGLFEPELQYWDIKGPQEIDPTRIPEFPASDLLQSIAGQNLKGAAFEVLLQNQERAQQADQRNQAFYSLAQQTGIPAAQLSPMANLDPDLLGPWGQRETSASRPKRPRFHGFRAERGRRGAKKGERGGGNS